MWRLTLMILFLNTLVYSQADTTRRQIEFSASAIPFRYSFVLHGEMAVNFPAHKNGWYNTLMLATTMQDYTVRGAGSLTNFQSFTAGKNYQYTRKWFFLSIGFNAGIYHHSWQNDNLSSRNFGIVVIPRLETGWAMKNIILSIGVYSAVGFGFYFQYVDGKPYQDSSPGFFDDHQFASIASPYVKLILK